jgi:hypothetical protein
MRRRNRRRRSGKNSATLQRTHTPERAKADEPGTAKWTAIFVAIITGAATIIAAVIGVLAATGNSDNVHVAGSITVSPPVTPHTAPPSISASNISPTLVPGDNSAFIKDVTYPDGSDVMVGQHFIKKWEIKDTGTVRWVGRYLAAIGESTGSCTYPTRVPVPITNPGQSAVISVPVTAATTPELCFVTWKMVNNDGTEYFPKLVGIWFDVKVVANRQV